jgi:hypothetical protein
VLERAAAGPHDYTVQARLLATATRGVDQIIERLQVPGPDGQAENLLAALRTLLVEHERLELELAMLGVEPPLGLAPYNVDPL